MQAASIYKAKMNLSAIAKRQEATIVTNHGNPVAVIVPIIGIDVSEVFLTGVVELVRKYGVNK